MVDGEAGTKAGALARKAEVLDISSTSCHMSPYSSSIMCPLACGVSNKEKPSWANTSVPSSSSKDAPVCTNTTV